MVRVKQRYLLAQVIMEKSNVELATRDLYSSITARVSQLLGVYGFGLVKASLSMKASSLVCVAKWS
jgi:RNase P/RNase MRP subunit POP5